jgi:hypothetical protein
VLLGLVGVVTLPAGVEVARRSAKVDLLDAAWSTPLALLLGIIATGLARRARTNLRWLQLTGGGTRVATTGLALGIFAVCLALAAALSVAFYELLLLYQHSR